MKQKVLISFDEDYGWIIELFNYESEEWEIENLNPWPNKKIDWGLASCLAKDNECSIVYYQRTGPNYSPSIQEDT